MFALTYCEVALALMPRQKTLMETREVMRDGHGGRALSFARRCLDETAVGTECLSSGDSSFDDDAFDVRAITSRC